MAGFIPLRAVIAAINAFLVLLVSVVTLTITMTVSMSALRDIGAQHAVSLEQGAEAKVAAYFDVPSLVVGTFMNESRRANRPLPSEDGSWRVFEDWSRMTFTMYLHTQLSLGGINLFFVDGTRISAIPSTGYPDTFITQNQAIDPVTGQMTRNYTWYYVDSLTKVDESNEVYVKDFSPPADIRTSGLMTALSLATGNGFSTIWSTPALLKLASGLRLFYVPVVAPMRRLDNKLEGYATVALYLDAISDFLRQVRGTAGTVAFALDLSGYVLASSHSYAFISYRVLEANEAVPPGCTEALTGLLQKTSTVSNRNVSCRLLASEHPYKPLRKIAGDKTFMFQKDARARIVDVDGSDYFIVTSKVPMRYDSLRIQLVLVVPEEDIAGTVIQGRNVVIGITCGVFVVVCAVSVIATAVLLKPLSTVSERMLAAATFDDHDENVELSTFTEIHDLQCAYYALNHELGRIRSYVPQSLLQSRQFSESGDDEEEPVSPADHTQEFRFQDADAASRRSDRPAAVAIPYGGHVSTTQSLQGGSGRQSERSSPKRSQSSLRQTTEGKRVTFVVTSPLASDIGLRTAWVSVISANLSGFHAACRDYDQSVIAARIGQTVEFIFGTVSAHRGVLDRFNGDHFIATFNASRACLQHSKQAVAAAYALTSYFGHLAQLRERRDESEIKLDNIATLPDDPEAPQPFALYLRAGVATGKAYVGNVGAESIKSFNVIGSAVTHSCALERLAKYYRRRHVVIPRRIFVEISPHFEIRPIDLVVLPGGKQPTVIGEVVRRQLVRPGLTAAAAADQQQRCNDDGTAPSRRRESRDARRRLPPGLLVAQPHEPRTGVQAADQLYLDDQDHPEYEARRMNLFIAIADGHLDVAEQQLDAMAEEIGSKSVTSDSGHTASEPSTTAQSVPLVPRAGHSPSTTAQDLPGDGAALLPQLSHCEMQLLRHELFTFVSLSDFVVPLYASLSNPLSSDPNSVVQSATQREAASTPTSLRSTFARDPNAWVPAGDPIPHVTTHELWDAVHGFVARVPTSVGVVAEAKLGTVGRRQGTFYDAVVAQQTASAGTSQKPKSVLPSGLRLDNSEPRVAYARRPSLRDSEGSHAMPSSDHSSSVM